MLKVRGNKNKKERLSGAFYRGAITMLFFSFAAIAQDANMLRSILPVAAPMVKERKMIYTYNFLFKECPSGNWWYYDSSNKRIVIEFYDSYVNVANNISIKGQVPVKEIEVRNLATSIVPSGKKTQILMHVKKPMHCEVNCFGDTLRVVLWKDLESTAKVQPRNRQFYSYLIPVTVVLITGILAISYLTFSRAGH